MKELGPTRFEKLAQASQDREKMINENLNAWLSENSKIESTLPTPTETTPLPFVKKIPNTVRKVVYAGLTFTGLSAACAGVGGNGKEAGQPEVESAGISDQFIIPLENLENSSEPVYYTGGPHFDGLSSGIRYAVDIASKKLVSCPGNPPQENMAVIASASGRVTVVGNENNLNDRNHSIVELDNGDGLTTGYMHLANIQIREGQRVQQGDILGKVSCEFPPGGAITGQHLHFYLKRNDQYAVINGFKLSSWTFKELPGNYQGTAEKQGEHIRTADRGRCGPDPTSIRNCSWIRNDLPQAVLRIETPTPTQGKPRVLSTQDIKIIRENLRQCRTAPDSEELSQDYWGGWIVENQRQDFWIKEFNALIELKSPEGFVLNSVKVVGARVVAPAGEKTWIVGTGRGGIGSRDIFPSFAYSGEGSRVTDINLILTGPFNWAEVLDKKIDYHLTSEVTEHRLNNPYNLAPGFARHELSFNITNTGNLALKNLTIFGFVYNLRGELVDMVWGGLTRPAEQNFVSSGETVEIKAPSVSNGRCVGKIDPVGYTLEYFVDFQGINENSLTVHDVVGIR